MIKKLHDLNMYFKGAYEHLTNQKFNELTDSLNLSTFLLSKFPLIQYKTNYVAF